MALNSQIPNTVSVFLGLRSMHIHALWHHPSAMPKRTCTRCRFEMTMLLACVIGEAGILAITLVFGLAIRADDSSSEDNATVKSFLFLSMSFNFTAVLFIVHVVKAVRAGWHAGRNGLRVLPVTQLSW
jgi:hypothetical protein